MTKNDLDGMDNNTDTIVSVSLSLTSVPSSSRVPFSFPSTASCSEIRQLVSTTSGIPLESLRVIFRGRMITDGTSGNVVEVFKINEGDVLHCMGKPLQPKPVVPTGGGGNHVAGARLLETTSTASVTGNIASTTNGIEANGNNTGDDLEQAIVEMKNENSPSTCRTALDTLAKILDNIISNPMEEKYRGVKKENAAFRKRLGGLKGGEQAMKAVGFRLESNGQFVMTPSADAWPKLLDNRRRVQEAASAAVNGTPATTGTGVSDPFGSRGSGTGTQGMMQGMGGLPGMPGMPNIPGARGPMTPGMASAVQGMLSNPQALQNMLQNPMVRNMMQNDPRIANNPFMRESIERISNEPATLEHMSRLMADPAMAEQMNAMMQTNGIGNGGGAGANMNPTEMAQRIAGFAGMPGTAPGASGSNSSGDTINNNGTSNSNSQGNVNGGNDSNQTEEEMIAEAIARSLRET